MEDSLCESIIIKTLTSLKIRLNNNEKQQIEMQLAEGYLTQGVFKFYPGASETEIDEFCKYIGYELPKDYIEFLQFCNGCQLFNHPEYGGESYLYSLEEIQLYAHEEPLDGYIKIGNVYQDHIVFDLKRYHLGDMNYVLVKGHIDRFDECRELNMSFEIWFDRFIVSQGSKYWTWPTITATNYNY
ncbi:SMI1/KNR4 family protein [Paenibacillus pini]|uniref:YokH protein n=1 Tax=Paenibacillus pini JCM 16418 TaxID=1236976 RepID=W7YDS4_9BACL|nr:SMI1/KNR4 family protein [Paenibacillus pini]GAF06612.1 YokH protein [Paenibacillus pini JCM 16418]